MVVEAGRIVGGGLGYDELAVEVVAAVAAAFELNLLQFRPLLLF